MPLLDVQKFIGHAIVADLGPEELAELLRIWPGLSEEEREDLQKIPHDRLYPYQADFYTFEGDMVAWGFEYTCKALEAARYGNTTDDLDDARHAFLVRMKSLHPSRTHSVRELGHHVVSYLRENCPDLLAQRPWLADLAEMERREIDVLYAMDNPLGRAIDGGAIDEFFAHELGAVLDAPVVRAEAVSALTAIFDLPALKDALAEDAASTTMPLASPQHWIIARDQDDLSPQWFSATPLEARLLEHVQEHAPMPLEALAEAYCEARENEGKFAASEEALLGEFLALMQAWFRRRYLLLA